MSPYRLLHVAPRGLSAYRRQGGELEQEGCFTTDEAGRSAFSAYLAARPRTAFRLLADFGDEELHIDSIPFLRGSDRQGLLERRLQLRLNGTPLRTAISLGYHRNRRKEENILLAGLGQAQLLAPWLQQLTAARAALAGIYSPVQLHGRLLQKLGFRESHSLLLTQQDNSLCESYLRQGRVVFSRRSGLNDLADATATARQMLGEALRLQQYLSTQRLIESDTRPAVHLVVTPEIIPALQAIAQEASHQPCQLTDTASAARRLKLGPRPDNADCTRLFLHLLDQDAPREQFAPSAQRHDFRLWQIRRALIATSFSLLFGSALFAAEENWRAHDLRRESLGYNTETRALQHRYEEMASHFPRADIDRETLIRLTSRFREFARTQTGPNQMYHLLGRALDDNPAIELEELLWEISPSDKSTAGNAQAGQESLRITGSLHADTTSSLRQNQASFEQFVAALRRSSENGVQVSRPPYSLASGQALRSNEVDAPGAGQFALEIVRRSPP